MSRATTTTRLSAGAVHLLSILDGYCTASARTRGEAVAFVSQAKLAERLQRSLATVKRCLAELVAAELVTVSRGYRAMNRYAMSRSNGSSMIPSNGSSVSYSDGSSMIPSNGSSMSRRQAAPISSDLVFTQNHLTPAAAGDDSAQNALPAEPSPAAAADASAATPAPLEAEPPAPVSALDVLTAAGLPAAVARPYAAADAGGLCHLAAAYYAERASKGDCTLGLLRDMLNKPAEYFRQDTAGNWQPPRDSMIHKSMKAADAAVKRREHAALLALQEAERKRLEAESKARSAGQLEADAAAWAALSDGERRGIAQGVGRELPASMSREPCYPDGTPTPYRLRCYAWMKQYAAAAARETAWQALPAPIRAQLEAEARKRFPLWASASADALHSICLMLMPTAEGRGHG